MTNKYLEKVAALNPLLRTAAIGAGIGGVGGAAVAGKDNRIKGALAGAAAGGVAGSVFGRLNSLNNKNIFGPGPGPGANAKDINPVPYSRSRDLTVRK